MCDLYEAARHNMPWLEEALWLCLALSAIEALAGLALWARARKGGDGMGWNAEQSRAWRARRRAEGGCTRCRGRAEPGRSECAGCARRHAADTLESYRRRKGQAGRHDAPQADAEASDPGRAARLAHYAARAAAGLPLFGRRDRGGESG